MAKYRLNLQAIEQSLREVQRQFPEINEHLQSRRDNMTDEVVENMLAGHTFVDAAICNDIDLFDPRIFTVCSNCIIWSSVGQT